MAVFVTVCLRKLDRTKICSYKVEACKNITLLKKNKKQTFVQIVCPKSAEQISSSWSQFSCICFTSPVLLIYGPFHVQKEAYQKRFFLLLLPKLKVTNSLCSFSPLRENNLGPVQIDLSDILPASCLFIVSCSPFLSSLHVCIWVCAGTRLQTPQQPYCWGGLRHRMCWCL